MTGQAVNNGILHLDLDAFYASVEQRDQPQLRGRPVVVGGSVNRGVVCACSYEARHYGIRSAMPMARALQLCPHAVLRTPRMKLYRQVSREVFRVFGRYTDRIEPLSLDEAFLDVRGSLRLFGEAVDIAAKIRKEVRDELQLTVSAGVARNKFLAKLASAHGKPDGLYVVPEPPDAFLLSLPLSRLWGVGPVTCRHLQEHGLTSVADLRRLGEAELVQIVGAAGKSLYHLIRGEDSRPVEVRAGCQSIGHEETFDRDLRNPQALHRVLLGLAEKVAARLRAGGMAAASVQLKVRYGDFSTVTRIRRVPEPLDSALEILQVAESLLQRTEAAGRPVRLLGISLSHLQDALKGQGDLFGQERKARQSALDGALDSLRQRFGERGVQRATLMADPKGRSGTKAGGDDGDGP